MAEDDVSPDLDPRMIFVHRGIRSPVYCDDQPRFDIPPLQHPLQGDRARKTFGMLKRSGLKMLC